MEDVFVENFVKFDAEAFFVYYQRMKGFIEEGGPSLPNGEREEAERRLRQDEIARMESEAPLHPGLTDPRLRRVQPEPKRQERPQTIGK